jgi:Tol biopolymer transport system component
LLLDTLIYNYYIDRETRTADGQWKLYVEDSGPGQTGIVIRSTAGEKVRRVVSGSSVNYEPAWSPDTMWVTFVSQRDGNDEIYVIDTNGQTPMRRTSNTWEWDRHPSWSADGRKIVFWSNREGGHKQIWAMNADGTDPRNLSSNGYDDWDPIWVK